jgi:hypothetical protein
MQELRRRNRLKMNIRKMRRRRNHWKDGKGHSLITNARVSRWSRMIPMQESRFIFKIKIKCTINKLVPFPFDGPELLKFGADNEQEGKLIWKMNFFYNRVYLPYVYVLCQSDQKVQLIWEMPYLPGSAMNKCEHKDIDITYYGFRFIGFKLTCLLRHRIKINWRRGRDIGN